MDRISSVQIASLYAFQPAQSWIISERAMFALKDFSTRAVHGQLNANDTRVTLTLLCSIWFVYIALLFVYRLYLSPLSKFPGSRICAVTELYEFYYSVVREGQWGNRVQEMHNKYGPIIRITPWELSVRDPEFYDQLYVTSSTRRTNMWARGREGNGFESSHHLTVDHDLHRQRRKHLEPFFTRQNIAKIEHILTNEALRLRERLVLLKGSGSIINMNHALAAMTGDTITEIACGMRADLLDDPKFSPEWYNLLTKMVMTMPVFKCFTWLNRLIQLLPTFLMDSIYPKGVSNKMLGSAGKQYIDKIKKEIATKGKADIEDKFSSSVFYYLLTANIPESERSSQRLQAESMILLLAGTLAGSHTLSFIVYYVLANPLIEAKLRKELEDAFGSILINIPTRTELEKLPYLRGCIKEALRLNGLVGNLARCSPDNAIQYKQYTIPRNTPVGMSIYHMHTNPDIFPQPFEYLPERWLGDYDALMDRNFVPFAKGSRNCIGINIAWTELFITPAVLFHPSSPKLLLYDTNESDIKITRDYIMGFPQLNARGLRITT